MIQVIKESVAINVPMVTTENHLNLVAAVNDVCATEILIHVLQV